MKTDLKYIATFISAIVWADGEYDEAEKICVASVAEALGLDAAALDAQVESISAEWAEKSEDEVNEILLEASSEVDEDEIDIIYEVVLELALIDGVLTEDEVANLIAISDALGIDTEIAVLRLANYVKDAPELEIELPE